MLEFLHPHIETHITDNSQYSMGYPTVSGSTILFQPFISEKGKDNKLIKYTSLKDFLSEFGTPNFRKHGQAIYNACEWLRVGGILYGMRMMPKNATYANIVLNVMTREITADESVKKLVVRLKMEALENLRDLSNLSGKIDSLPKKTTTEEDGEGSVEWNNHYVAVFLAGGRGSYGNEYSINIKANNYSKKLYDYRCYDVNILESNNHIEGPYTVSMHPWATNVSGNALSIEEIIKSYAAEVQCKYFEFQYEELVSRILAVDPTIDVEQLDFLFCRDVDFEPYEKLILDEKTESIDQLIGIRLQNGSNGDLDNPKYESVDELDQPIPTRDEIIKQLYIDTYSGVLNENINNKKAYPFDVILDSALPVEVKTEILEFCKKRGDVFPFFDCGLVPNKTEAELFRENYFNVSTYIGAIYGTTFKVKDPYGVTEITLTAPYFIGSKLPSHDRTLGVQYPLAGPNYGLLSGFVPESINFNPDEYAQEDLYIAQVNYAVQDEVSTELGTQNTLQKTTSALSSINNVRSLFKIVRAVENVSRKYKFEFNDERTLARFQEDLLSISNEWITNKACTSLELQVYQTKYDVVNKVCRVKASIVFNGVIERIVIEINIGK